MPKRPRLSFTEFQDTIRGLLDERVIPLGDGISKLEKFIHFWVMVGKSFVRNRCPVRASALSYTTLLALIPMLAVAMSVTSIFLKSEGQQQIETFIQEFVDRMIPEAPKDTNVFEALDFPAVVATPPIPETNEPAETATTNLLASQIETNAPAGPDELVGAPSMAGGISNAPAGQIGDQRVIAAQKEAARYIHSFIQNTYSGTLGVTGMVFLLLTAILTLTRIEEAFNDIWGVVRGRDWLTRVVNYFTTITLGPALLFGALGLASGPRLQTTRQILTAVPLVETVVSQVLPVVVICLSFALFYKLVPNTKVRFSAALVGGTLAGVSWHVYNLLGFMLASRAVNASKIYGSLALVPLFMGGLYVVWLTVLFGAQVAYAFQNREAYLQEKLAENVNQRGREFVALRLLTCIGQRFQRGLPLATVPDMSKELGIPSRLVQQVLQTLLTARLVVEVSRGEPAYAPARPLEDISAHHVLMAMRATVGQELVTRDEPVRAEVYGEFARIQAAEKAAAASLTMLALVNRAQERLELAPPADDTKPAKQVMALAPSIQTTAAPSRETTTAKPVLVEPVPPPAPAAIEQPLPSSKPDASPTPAANLIGEAEERVERPGIAPTPPTAEAATAGKDSFPL